jgi:hypothetical protein
MVVVVENKNIFISGNFTDTAKDIELVHHLLAADGFNVNVKVNDDGPSTSEMIERCDIFLAIVSDQEGAIKNADDKTLPQAEMDLAISLRRSIIALLKHPDRRGASVNQENMREMLRERLGTKLITYDNTSQIRGIARDFLLRGFDAFSEIIAPDARDTYHSVFLIYGGPDESVARRFYETFSRWGIACFFFPESAEPGKRLHRTMYDGINDHDRVVLLCSRSSLERPGVLNEIERLLSREASEGGTELVIPVALDDHVFTTWEPSRGDLAAQMRERVVADFRHAVGNPKEFRKQFARLLKALEK